MVGLGEPRVVRAGVVGGSYFEVMGLRPVLGRLLDATDDGPNAAGAAVLTYRFWTTALGSDPAVLGKTVRLGDRVGHDRRRARAVGALPVGDGDHRQRRHQPASPVATMVDGRVHRMTELFGRLAPGADLEAARAELRAVHGAMVKAHPEAYPRKARLPHRRRAAARSDHLAGAHRAAGPAGRVGAGLRHRLLERREPDPGAVGAPRRRAGDSRGARRQRRRAPPHAAGREPAALRRRRDPRRR